MFYRRTLSCTLLTLCLILFVACSPPDLMDESDYDILIVNGTIFDGSQNPGRIANIAVVGDRIVSVNASADAKASRVIDASDLVVVPGFIDPHTHALDDLLGSETHSNTNYLTQGVTTVFVGNDGGVFVGNYEEGMPDRTAMIRTMQTQGIGTNVGFFAGHNEIRNAVMGLEDRAPTDDELLDMQKLVAEEMSKGALGLSTGLFYRPGSYAETDELIALARIAREFGGVFDSHLRDESSYNIGLRGSIMEVLQIGREADIPVHVAHLKALGRDVWGQSGDIIALIDAARAEGYSVTADQYPWRASGTNFSNAVVPRWVMADSEDAMFARFANPDLADRIRKEMENNIWRRGGADSMLVTGESEWRGMTLGDIAEQLALGSVEAAIEMVRSGDPNVASFNMTVDDIGAFAIQPWVMTGSDGTDGHPRKYASYPKAYRDFVVEQKLLSMEKFVYRSSGLVADTFSLCDRGYIEEGRLADIAILDLGSYLPAADFENPTRIGTGVTYLLVNGKPTIDDSVLQETPHGIVINRQNFECPQ